jgi:hypothetical protein
MNKYLLTLLLIVILSKLTTAQIYINGGNPSRYGANSYNGSSISVAYGNVIWFDGAYTRLEGYSLPLKPFYNPENQRVIEKLNIASGVSIGFETNISRRSSLFTSIFTGFMSTGSRFNDALLVSDDKSTLSQIATYFQLTLSSPEKRLKINWLIGPEILYARKRIVVEEYVTPENQEPKQYNEDLKIIEGALVTGLGLSYDISRALSLFNNSSVGLAFPGNGIKGNLTSIGIKYKL